MQLSKGSVSLHGLVYTIALSAIFPCYSSRLSCSLTSPMARQNVRNTKERQYINKGNPLEYSGVPFFMGFHRHILYNYV